MQQIEMSERHTTITINHPDDSDTSSSGEGSESPRHSESPEPAAAWGLLKHSTISRDQTASSGFEEEKLLALRGGQHLQPKDADLEESEGRAIPPLFESYKDFTRSHGNFGASARLPEYKPDWDLYGHSLDPRILDKGRAIRRASGFKHQSRGSFAASTLLPAYQHSVHASRATAAESGSEMGGQLTSRRYKEQTMSNLHADYDETYWTSSGPWDEELEVATRPPVSTGTRELELQSQIRELERTIELLRASEKVKETKEATSQVFNIITDGDNQMLCLGEPTWGSTNQPGAQSLFLKDNCPIADPDGYIRRQGNIAFVVYRYFSASSRNEAVNKALLEDLPLPAPKPATETISLVSDDMVEAARAFFKTRPKVKGGIRLMAGKQPPTFDAPFLFWYTCRSTRNHFEGLSAVHRRLMGLFTSWIEKNYGPKYDAADALFKRGLISASTMPFFIRPGEVLVERINEKWTGSMATDWAKPTKAGLNDDLDRSSSDAGSGNGDVGESGSNDMGDRDAVPGSHLNHGWVVPTWRYAYDGRFWKDRSETTISFKADYDDHEVKISSLTVKPLRLSEPSIRESLERRGKMFWACRRKKLISYRSDDDGEQLSGEERYMTDFATYRKLHSDSAGFKGTYKKIAAHNYMSPDVMMRDDPPSAPNLFLFPRTIAGFSLRRKKWVDLDVDLIEEVKWHKEAFSHLVVPDESKELIEALVTNKIAADKGTDWITAKGNGLIILLHGGPGTGKTFTAESVAEFAEKPLYSVTCGDIGTQPDAVERYLESALHLCKLWDCVVLLDEADVFLEQRTLNDLTRNALVSSFLRVLEYYEGILILTSNRVGTFDEAFKSRIQLTLHYENLERDQRAKIWKNFFSRLKLLGEENIDYDVIDSYSGDLSEFEMNGRQIRNAITTARQLAQFKGKPMNFGHLRHVINVAGKFDHYLKLVHETLSDDDIARGDGVR